MPPWTWNRGDTSPPTLSRSIPAGEAGRSTCSAWIFYGNALFTGDPYSHPYGASLSELDPSLIGTFGGRDITGVADAFGETFLYYSTRNPSTGLPARKVTFVKRVMVFGVPVLLAAGYYPEDLDHEHDGGSDYSTR